MSQCVRAKSHSIYHTEKESTEWVWDIAEEKFNCDRVPHAHESKELKLRPLTCNTGAVFFPCLHFYLICFWSDQNIFIFIVTQTDTSLVRGFTHFVIEWALFWCDRSRFPWWWEFNFHQVITALLPLACMMWTKCHFQYTKQHTQNIKQHIFNAATVSYVTSCSYSCHRNVAKRPPSTGACPRGCLPSRCVWPPHLRTGYWYRYFEPCSEGLSLMHVFWSPETQDRHRIQSSATEVTIYEQFMCSNKWSLWQLKRVTPSWT